MVQAFALRNESSYNSERSEIFREVQNKMLKILFFIEEYIYNSWKEE